MMQTKRTYQVQHWPNGEWNPEHNWRKVEAASEKEAAEKVCGLALTQRGTLAQLRARVLTFGDLKQRTATPFLAVEYITGVHLQAAGTQGKIVTGSALSYFE